MQFQSIIAALSIAIVATAMPTTPSGATTTCSGNNTAAYCSKNSAGGLLGGLTGVLTILPITVPITVTNLLSCVTLLPILSGNQQVANACCPNSGVQNGLANVGSVCVPVNV